MVTAQDQDFYNLYRLLGCSSSVFREIFHGFSPQDIKWMEKNYRANERQLKIAHRAWWEKWKCEKITDVSPCCG
ncbi:MAG: hypothetical protein Q8O71_04160 [bacterium]|nr:hypothetical protein [bacterium]